MPDAEIFMASDTYIDYPQPNMPIRIDAGKTARVGHPIIERTPSMWVPLKVDYEVEQPKAETPKRMSGKMSSA